MNGAQAWCGAVAVVIASFALAPPLRAATITGASISASGRAVELDFAVRGRNLRWSLSPHKQELWIDLSGAALAIARQPLEGRELPPVKAVTVAASGGDHARVIVQVGGKVDYAIASLPGRLAIRFAPAGTVPDLAAPLLMEAEAERERAAPRVASRPRRHSRGRAVAARDANKTIATRRLADDQAPETVVRDPMRQIAIQPPHPLAGHPLIVIDPGHGGRDPGTSAADGVEEKTVVLEIARKLQAALEARGANAELTRESDMFLTLAERTRMANRAGADLFISIHLNSSPDANTTGMETYYLNNTTDRATIRLARMENGVAGGYGAPSQANLHYILSDLRQGYKANESASLARMIEADAAASVDAALRLRVNELGAKKGPFYVLVGADMPSVLVECGFLSNSGEARLLEQPDYQSAIAAGIAGAVVHYFNADAAVGNL